MALCANGANRQRATMTSDHLQRAAAALQALDADDLVGLYADPFRFEDPALGQVLTGRQELRAYFAALFGASGTKFSDVEFFSAGDRGAGRWTWSATNSSTGRRFAIRGASIFELGPEGITRETIYYDPTPSRTSGD